MSYVLLYSLMDELDWGIASMEEKGNADKVLVGKCEGQWPHERQV